MTWTIHTLTLPDGRCSFCAWMKSLKDQELKAAIYVRLARMEQGNFGDHKAIAANLYELRIHKGPGIRVYYGLSGKQAVLLIAGGSKKTQKADINEARRVWREYTHAN